MCKFISYNKLFYIALSHLITPPSKAHIWLSSQNKFGHLPPFCYHWKQNNVAESNKIAIFAELRHTSLKTGYM